MRLVTAQGPILGVGEGEGVTAEKNLRVYYSLHN